MYTRFHFCNNKKIYTDREKTIFSLYVIATLNSLQDLIRVRIQGRNSALLSGGNIKVTKQYNNAALNSSAFKITFVAELKR